MSAVNIYFVCISNLKKEKDYKMIPPPTQFEKFIHMRINFRIFNFYVGTGHFISNYYDTDEETESTESEVAF